MATKEEKAARRKAREEAAAKEAAKAEAAAADGDNDDDSDDDSEDAPTEATENTSPDGQTASGSSELGDASDFEEPVTQLDNLGTKQDTRVRNDDDEDSGKVPTLFTSLTKALGLKNSQLLGFNERTRVAVYSNGGKYQVSKNRKSVRHLAGPKPPADMKLNVVDARSRSPFVGTAAALNASVHDDTSNDALVARRAALQAELAAVDARIAEG